MLDLKSGDTVVIDSRFDEKVAVIDRLTKTQIIIGDQRFRREDGTQIPESDWNQTLVYAADAKKIAEVSASSARRRLNAVNWICVTDENVTKIAEIVWPK